MAVAVKHQPHPVFSKDPERARRVSEVLKAVAHPLRIRIVAILAEKDENVTALAETLEAPQAIVSQQLRILRSPRGSSEPCARMASRATGSPSRTCGHSWPA